MEYLKRQIEARQQAWHAAKSLLDAAAAEKRDLTAEEEQSYARMMADIDERSDRIADLERAEARSRDIEAALVQAPEVRAEVRETTALSDSDILRQLALGDRRSYTFERRALSTGSGIVPTEFLDALQENMQYTGPMLDPAFFTRIDTVNGNDITVPTETSRAVATAVAEGAGFATSDPVFSSVTLRAHKYGTLVLVSRELLVDSGIDLVGYLGRSIGVALGTAVNSALTLGTGTVQPQGIAGAAGSGVTGGTGVSGVPTFDNLIDLMASVDTAYAARPQAAWMMRRATLAKVRKLQDTGGAYLWSPASSVGQPDRILGFPVLENPYVAAAATNAKSVLFGDMSSFHVRVAGGIEIARSDEAFFTSDQVAFRARILVDGALGQSAAVKYFAGGTA